MKRTALFQILLWSAIATTEASAQGTSSLAIARAVNGLPPA